MSGPTKHAQKITTAYVASKVIHAPMWRHLRGALQLRTKIISTWIDEADPGQTNDEGELAERCIREAKAAEIFVLYLEPDDVVKGALIEVGARLGDNKAVHCVGRCDNWPRIFAKHRLWIPCASLAIAFGWEKLPSKELEASDV